MIAKLRLVWEVPLALASYLVFKTTRFVLRLLVSAHHRRHAQEPPEWRVTSADFLNKPLVLPVVMTEAPRWNPHAITAVAGPIEVRESLALEMHIASASSRLWWAVVHTFPKLAAVASISSSRDADAGPWKDVSLQPGKYTLILRYYGWSDAPVLPGVRADGADVVLSTPLDASVNEFYSRLASRSGLFYRCLHYYVYILVKYAWLFPQRLVEREFLPVGNPDTQFYYGVVPARQTLHLELGAAALATHEVYLTVYDLASFPTSWCRIAEPACSTDASPKDRLYLVRILKHVRDGRRFPDCWIRIEAGSCTGPGTLASQR